MERNKLIIFIAIVLAFTGCFLKKEKVIFSETNSLLKKAKATFSLDYNKVDLTKHFPDLIEPTDVILLNFSPPSCLPSNECSAQFGDMCLISKMDTSNICFLDSVIFETRYLNDSNIIINLNELKRTVFPIEKCNKYFADKFPIPYFESYDFGFGKKETKKEVNGELHFDYTYVIPSDLQVYVLQAEAGNFWKKSCNEIRPEELKQWKNGFSKGIAISKKENIIVYWLLIW